MPHNKHMASIEDIIDDARNGRMFILVDDEDRENEGDLVIPGQMATPDAVNFMAKYGRGLICLALAQERVKELDLPLMVQNNASRHDTAFTVSIEAREGVSTGISASDRARTIAVAIDSSQDASGIVSPGHIFPLAGRAGGVLVRAGHTEAALDISRLAGLNPSGVICEIMSDDGAMARTPELVEFAKTHELKIGTISDLIAYRLRHDRIVERVLETKFQSKHGGEFQMYIYVNRIAYAEHIALVKGDISKGGPAPVRMHALNILEDVLGDKSSGKADELHQAMKMIEDFGRGVIVLIREPHRSSISDRVRSKMEAGGKRPSALRDYGVGAQILLDLGITDMILLSNTKHTIIGLEGYGLNVCEQIAIKES